MNASGEVIVDARSRSRRLIGWFALFCGLFCLVCYPPILGAGSLSDAQWWVFAIMWSPGIAALLARLVVQRNLHGMGWRPAWRMVTLAWAIPLALCLLVYGSVWLSGLGGFDPSNIPGDVPVAGRIALLATLGVLWSLTRAAGEWNHYYIRAINGEVRLWVNGEEVNGGHDCQPAEGYLALEAEGAPVEFRNLRIRELP